MKITTLTNLHLSQPLVGLEPLGKWRKEFATGEGPLWAERAGGERVIGRVRANTNQSFLPAIALAKEGSQPSCSRCASWLIALPHSAFTLRSALITATFPAVRNFYFPLGGERRSVWPSGPPTDRATTRELKRTTAPK